MLKKRELGVVTLAGVEFRGEKQEEVVRWVKQTEKGKAGVRDIDVRLSNQA